MNLTSRHIVLNPHPDDIYMKKRNMNIGAVVYKGLTTFNQVVAGSSPARLTNNIKDLEIFL